jgi:hypothetical protein
MLGNQLGVPGRGFTPRVPLIGPRAFGAVLVPSVRGFRITEDESPRPLDRVYFDFNFFDDVNQSVNRRLGNNIHDIQVYRETFAVEKTCLDGDASIGLRLPVDTLRAETAITSLAGTNTDFGDLIFILKYAFCNNRETGSLASAGVVVSVPTGPSSFAGSGITTFHDTILEPFVGYIWNSGDFYLHGFIGVDVPTDSNDVTYFFNSFGAGYHLARSQDEGRCITDIIPTLEMHLSDPLNHRGALNLQDPAASADSFSLTTGVIFELKRHATLALGINTPLTGPKPYNWEFLAQFNWRFGPRAAGAAGAPGFVLGG